MNKTLILIRGLSSSGKTDLADIIVGESEDRMSLSVQDFFVSDEGEYHFEPAQLKPAHEWCVDSCEDLLSEGHSVVVVHNCFTRKWEVDPYMELGNRFGYRIHVINLYDRGLNDLELSQVNVHDINPNTIQKQRQRWDKDVYRNKSSKNATWRQPFRPYNSWNPRRRGRYN